jgi:transketolase
LRPGADVLLISTGLMTMRALQAAERLASDRVDVTVLHCLTIKPFDSETVVAEATADRVVLTLENHTVIGGLFETVASALVLAGANRHVHPVALPDACLDAGALPTLHDRYGLSTDRVVTKVLDLL